MREVESANRRFYEAFERLSIQEMDEIWSHADDVVCIHPGWNLITGWQGVRESWSKIFSNAEYMRIVLSDTKIRVTGEISWVVCLGNITSRFAGYTTKFGVLATNMFRREDGIWRMIHDHGSPVSSYVTPPKDRLYA